MKQQQNPKENSDSMQGDTNACKICGKTLKTKSFLEIHEAKHFEIKKQRPEPRYPCKVCGQLYRSKDYLRYHEARHISVIRVKCKVCHKEMQK